MGTVAGNETQDPTRATYTLSHRAISPSRVSYQTAADKGFGT